jgi:betaine reductase
MELKGRKAFVLGERDGVQAQSIVNSLKTTGVEIAYIDTQCFV